MRLRLCYTRLLQVIRLTSSTATPIHLAQPPMASSMAVDEIPSMALAASVMDELRLLDPPPQDEYAGSQELPPAYNTFEIAYSHWCDTDKAKQDITVLDQDPAFAATETELKEAKLALKQMGATSKKLYEKSQIKRKSFTSYFGRFGKSNRKANPPDASGTASVNSSHSPMEVDSPATEMFKRAHEAEMKQGLLVDRIAAKVETFKDKRQALSNLASGNDLSWNRLRGMVEEILSGRAEVAVAISEGMEKMEAAETRYNVVKKTASDLIRARLVVQHAHHYFTQTLKISDDIRGTTTGRVFGSALGGGGGINDMTKKIQYGDAVRMASKAQVCLNEMFRVMEPYENMLPADRMTDYTSLNKIGLMQMSKIYNLMWCGSILDQRVAESTKALFEQQETAFAYLTPLAVWIQDRAPVCSKEADGAEKLRDDVRREVAAVWNADVSISGQP